MQKQQMLQRPVQKRKDQGDFAVVFWKLRVTEQDRKKVTEIWEIILYAVKRSGSRDKGGKGTWLPPEYDIRVSWNPLR